jgi:hypothetical protein
LRPPALQRLPLSFARFSNEADVDLGDAPDHERSPAATPVKLRLATTKAATEAGRRHAGNFCQQQNVIIRRKGPSLPIWTGGRNVIEEGGVLYGSHAGLPPSRMWWSSASDEHDLFGTFVLHDAAREGDDGNNAIWVAARLLR